MILLRFVDFVLNENCKSDYAFTDTPPAGIISVRVAYTRTYQVVITPGLITHYGFDVNQTNDVDEEIFLAIRSRSTYIQLVHYEVTGDFSYNSNIDIQIAQLCGTSCIVS